MLIVPLSLCEQLGILSEEKESLLGLWEVRRQQYEQCMDLQLFYRDTEQVDNWMSKQEVRGRSAALWLDADGGTDARVSPPGVPAERGPGGLPGQRGGSAEEARGL